MLKYYLSKQYRKTYKQLKSIDIFSQQILVDYEQYNSYLKYRVILDPRIDVHIQIFQKQKITSFKIIKILLFMHCWLQHTCVVQNREGCLKFMGRLLEGAEGAVGKVKQLRVMCQTQLTKRNLQIGNNANDNTRYTDQIQYTKEIYLLESIIKPYVLYLQKLIANFQFYNILKKSLAKTLGKEDIWVLLNLFTYLNAVSVNTTVLGKFIKKSFVPLAIAISHAISSDIFKFYSKINKYISSLCSKIQKRYLNQNKRQTTSQLQPLIPTQIPLQLKTFPKQPFDSYEGIIQQLINIKQDVKQLNNKLQILYSDFIINQNLTMNEPIFIDTQSPQILFICSLKRTYKNQNTITPKFIVQNHQNMNEMVVDEKLWIKGSQKQKNGSIFSDITNSQDLCTFRMGNKELHNNGNSHSNKVNVKGKGSQFRKFTCWTTEN